jgi:general nucleoside transport system permease protein
MLQLERRAAQRAHLYVAVPVVAVGAALGFGALFLAANGFSPALIYAEMARASFATRYGIEETLVSATPLIFTGLAAAVAFRFRLYNVGAEGQLIVGGICCAGAALALGERAPTPVVLAAGMLGGAVWIAVPALARARLGTSEIITTLLLNYVAVLLARYLIFGSRSMWRDPAATNFPQGRALPPATWLPELAGTPVHVGLLGGVACAVLIFAVLRWTRMGFEARVFGDSPAAAAYAGISATGVVLSVLIVSGAVAGLSGASEVAGRAHRLDPTGLAVGFGYTGIIVAALARYHPLAVVPVALFVGALSNAGSAVQTLPGGVPSAISTVLQGAILVFVLASEIHISYRLRWRRREPIRS